VILKKSIAKKKISTKLSYEKYFLIKKKSQNYERKCKYLVLFI